MIVSSHRHSLVSAPSTVSLRMRSPLLFVSAAILIYVGFLEQTTVLLAIFIIQVLFYTQMSEIILDEKRTEKAARLRRCTKVCVVLHDDVWRRTYHFGFNVLFMITEKFIRNVYEF
jgi:hypothetical protein